MVISLCNIAFEAHFVTYDMKTLTHLALVVKQTIGPCVIK
jgi:hypothetical protein